MFSKLTVLSFAASAMAAPALYPTGSGAPYPVPGNSTGIWGTGTGTAGSACSLVYKTKTPADITSTSIVLETGTVTSTITVTGVKAADTGLAGGAGGAPGVGGGVCKSRSTVTATTTEKVYITVTGGASTSAAPAESSTPAPVLVESPSSSFSFVFASTEAPESSVQAEATSAPPAPAYTAPPAPPSPSAAPPAPEPASSSAPAPSSEAAPVPSSSAAPVESSSTAPSTPAAPAPSSPANGGSHYSGPKRGLSYNDASLTECFAGEAGWAYNWGSTRSGLPSSFDYAPMLWSTRSDFTSVWEKNVADAISAGSTCILGFNEPDHHEQANMSPGAAVEGWKQYMEPVKAANSEVRLGSPAVTNGGGSMGLNWLGSFMEQCSGCNIDFVNIHWYDSAKNVEYFKNHIQQAHEQTKKPVWVTEFGASGSDSEVSSFLAEVIPWLNSQDYVERFAYFMAKDGILNSGTGKSAIGAAYASA